MDIPHIGTSIETQQHWVMFIVKPASINLLSNICCSFPTPPLQMCTHTFVYKLAIAINVEHCCPISLGIICGYHISHMEFRCKRVWTSVCWLIWFLYSPGDGRISSVTLVMVSAVPINVTWLRLLWVLGAVNTNDLSKFRILL